MDGLRPIHFYIQTVKGQEAASRNRMEWTMEKLNCLKPACYDRFQCKGGACKYTCCQGWKISMTREEYKKWKKRRLISGRLWDQYMTFVPEKEKNDHRYAMFQLTDKGFCPLLDSDGLCQIQKNHGFEALTHTCQVYPRQTHRYFDQVECSLSLGCEGVLELLLEEKQGLLLSQDQEAFPPGFFFGSWYRQNDRRAHPQLGNYYDIQTLCLALLQKENASLEGRMLLLGIALYEIDKFYESGRKEAVAPYIGSYLSKVEHSNVEQMFTELPAGTPLAGYNSVFTSLSRLNPDDNFALRDVRTRILNRLHPLKDFIENNRDSGNVSMEQWKSQCYTQCMGQFSIWIKGKEYFLENMMTAYLLYSNTPFKDITKSVWENYLYFVWVYIMVKISLSAYLLPDSPEEDMIHCCAVLFRTFGHNSNLFNQIIHDFKADGNTPAHLAILLKNCSGALPQS